MKLPIREQWNRNIFLDDETVVKYSVPNENRQLFASKYMLYLPTEEALREELERERALVVREQQAQYAVALHI